MARPIRVEYANAVYHLTARGNERRAIYRDDRDRQGLLLGGEALLEKVRQLLATHAGQEEIRWRRRVAVGEVSRVVRSLAEREEDRRVAIWLRVRRGGERMTEIAEEYGYRDGSGVCQVVKRLEQRAKHDRLLSTHLAELANALSSVKS
jgi:hypothetical protein